MTKYPLAALAFLLMSLLSFSCKPDPVYEIPTREAFDALRQKALDNRMQQFTFNAEDGVATFVSEKGVSLRIDGTCLYKNGAPVTGKVDVTFLEIFDRGSMLVTNKPTVGFTPDGKQAMLVSGGEFYIDATQDGIQLYPDCDMELLVPTSLSGGSDPGMKFFIGEVGGFTDVVAWFDTGDSLEIWNGPNPASIDPQYRLYFNHFGWTNCDRFVSFTGPQTIVEVAVPLGYDIFNSAVYLSQDGEIQGLLPINSFDTGTGLFSSYAEIAAGINCRIIFASARGNEWEYAIKSVTIQPDGVITFKQEDLKTASETELTQAINGMP